MLYSGLLVIGLVASQYLPHLGPGAYAGAQVAVGLLTMLFLGFIMIHVGYELEIDRSRPAQHAIDYGVAATAAGPPWIFCSLYLIFVMSLPSAWWSYEASGLGGSPRGPHGHRPRRPDPPRGPVPGVRAGVHAGAPAGSRSPRGRRARGSRAGARGPRRAAGVDPGLGRLHGPGRALDAAVSDRRGRPRRTLLPGGGGAVALHTLAITLLANLGKMSPLFCYRRESHWRERLALCIGMWPRGEVGAGVLVVSLAYGLGGATVTVATLSLALNLLCPGAFIYLVKRILKGVPAARPGSPDPAA